MITLPDIDWEINKRSGDYRILYCRRCGGVVRLKTHVDAPHHSCRASQVRILETPPRALPGGQRVIEQAPKPALSATKPPDDGESIS